MATRDPVLMYLIRLSSNCFTTCSVRSWLKLSLTKISKLSYCCRTIVRNVGPRVSARSLVGTITVNFVWLLFTENWTLIEEREKNYQHFQIGFLPGIEGGLSIRPWPVGK